MICRRGRVFQNVDPHEHGSSPGSSEPFSPALVLVGFVGLCLLVGAADAAVTSSSVRTWYLALTAPPGTPPNWAFGPIWTALYVLVGIAGWLVWCRVGAARPIRLWGWQLLLNALWTPAFFGLHRPALALGIILTLLVMIALTMRAFTRARPLAAGLMAPYLAWTCYAAYLNAGFWWLNRV